MQILLILGRGLALDTLAGRKIDYQTDPRETDVAYPAEQVRQIRELAHQRLRRLDRSDNSPTEAYVFKDDRFCGIRFRHGRFFAQWMLDDNLIEFFRENRLIDQIRLDASDLRAA